MSDCDSGCDSGSGSDSDEGYVNEYIGLIWDSWVDLEDKLDENEKVVVRRFIKVLIKNTKGQLGSDLEDNKANQYAIDSILGNIK